MSVYSTIIKTVEQALNYILGQKKENVMKKTYLLDGLCCANCAAKIERGIAAIDGVTNASVSFLTTKLVIEGEDEKMEEIIEAAMKVVKKIEPDVEVEEY